MKPPLISSKYILHVRAILILFFAVGIVGIGIPSTRNLVIALTPFALLLSTLVLILFHAGKVNIKFGFIVLAILIMGFFAEVIGVQTGLLFGEYVYGNTLGLKLFETPLFIGLNWLMLTYAFFVVTSNVFRSKWLSLVVASLGMLIYDWVMEPSASFMDMWHWENDTIPMHNYLGWAFFALFFQAILHFSGLQIKNRMAVTIIACQFLFFLFISSFKTFTS